MNSIYAKYIKRILDFFISLTGIIVLLPLLFILTIVGAIVLKGNPFFVQERPGKNEKIFKLVKFRTMSNEKNQKGELLSDSERLNKYGRFLRKTSLDELPELFNIVKGDMAIVGPRPLLVKYLPYYTQNEHQRHSVRPGLTGYAQVNGRNTVSWEERFQMDLWYINNLSLKTDISIIFDTIKVVFNRNGIALNVLEDFDEYRKHNNTEIRFVQQ